MPCSVVTLAVGQSLWCVLSCLFFHWHVKNCTIPVQMSVKAREETLRGRLYDADESGRSVILGDRRTHHWQNRAEAPDLTRSAQVFEKLTFKYELFLNHLIIFNTILPRIVKQQIQLLMFTKSTYITVDREEDWMGFLAECVCVWVNVRVPSVGLPLWCMVSLSIWCCFYHNVIITETCKKCKLQIVDFPPAPMRVVLFASLIEFVSVQNSNLLLIKTSPFTLKSFDVSVCDKQEAAAPHVNGSCRFNSNLDWLLTNLVFN